MAGRCAVDQLRHCWGMAITRGFVAAAMSLAAMSAGSIAAAQSPDTSAYPTRPMRLIVPFPPGGGNDILARSVGQRLSPIIGQQIVVDNRGGAGGVLGATLAAKAPPDGYTLFLGSLGNLAHNPALKESLPYKPLSDFETVTLLATSSLVLAVNPRVQADSVSALLALAKANPGKLNYASAGAGSSLHMTAELFKHATGANLLHVPYKGTGPALTDLVGGRVDLIFSTMPPVLPHLQGGRLHALGVTTAKRARSLPDVPTIAESGVAGFDVSNWQGIVTPRHTPVPIVRKLNQALLDTLNAPGMADALAKQGLEAAGGTPAQFRALIGAEIARYTNLVKATGIRID
ncbi:MAG: Bug family tripartite tricarboxylate transporter substrate binding protein [Burkholderiales bacterium]